VAFSFGIESGRTRYCIATSYDARYPRHSLGYLACYKTYIAAAERGIERLSLGVGDGGEKSSMGAAPEGDLVDCLFVRGRLLAAALRLAWR
jgi:CelD/BcsL family acetyltransferase involved in cellulose biosynthesis